MKIVLIVKNCEEIFLDRVICGQQGTFPGSSPPMCERRRSSLLVPVGAVEHFEDVDMSLEGEDRNAERDIT